MLSVEDEAQPSPRGRQQLISGQPFFSQQEGIIVTSQTGNLPRTLKELNRSTDTCRGA